MAPVLAPRNAKGSASMIQNALAPSVSIGAGLTTTGHPPMPAHFFSSMSVPSLRIAGTIFSASLASSHGSVTSRRT